MRVATGASAALRACATNRWPAAAAARAAPQNSAPASRMRRPQWCVQAISKGRRRPRSRTRAAPAACRCSTRWPKRGLHQCWGLAPAALQGAAGCSPQARLASKPAGRQGAAYHRWSGACLRPARLNYCRHGALQWCLGATETAQQLPVRRHRPPRNPPAAHPLCCAAAPAAWPARPSPHSPSALRAQMQPCWWHPTSPLETAPRPASKSARAAASASVRSARRVTTA